MDESGVSIRRSSDQDGPIVGRVALLIGAYAPVGLIIAARTWPGCVAYISAAIGIAGLLPWIVYLQWMPGTQPREVDIKDIEAVDSEVAGYIVSILLPIVAATGPTPGDIVAYSLCGALILLVAYISGLAVVNPLIYLLGYRIARVTIESERTLVLVKNSVELTEGSVTVVRAVSVTLVPGT